MAVLTPSLCSRCICASPISGRGSLPLMALACTGIHRSSKADFDYKCFLRRRKFISFFLPCTCCWQQQKGRPSHKLTLVQLQTSKTSAKADMQGSL